MIDKIRWYHNRLKKMSGPEVIHRLGQSANQIVDRYSGRSLAEKMARVDDPPPAAFDRIELDSEPFPAADRVTSLADRFLRHEFEIFGDIYSYGPELDFHRDPKTGKSRPVIFWGDIDHREAESIGGIKFAWEINRLHHWPVLGLAHALTRDPVYLNEVLAQLNQWLDQNPYPWGINWISGIELGIRLVNLYYCLAFAGTESISQAQWSRISFFVNIHGRHLRRYPSKYSSCANHALAEALGLFVAGSAFPYLNGAAEWRRFGKQVLDREVLRQIHADGSSFEHTVPYLQFVVDHFLLYYLYHERHGLPVADGLESRLAAAFDFISAISDVNGHTPMIGDDDDGYLLKLNLDTANNFQSLMTTGAVLFGRTAPWPNKAEPDIKTRLLLGRRAADKWAQTSDRVNHGSPSRYFEDAGLAVIRHGDPDDEILFLGNSGPLGLAPLAGHGHADALSIWLSVKGAPIFIDPGTYLYHGGGRWRRYFRSTAAHNTIEIDGCDQADQRADFIWDNFYTISRVRFLEEDDRVYWEAAHDGYSRLPSPVVHHRQVVFWKTQQRFVMTDTLETEGRHEARMFFHLHPDVEPFRESDRAFKLTSGGATVILRWGEGMSCLVLAAEKDPVGGWYSPGFGRLQESAVLCLQRSINGRTKIDTEIEFL